MKLYPVLAINVVDPNPALKPLGWSDPDLKKGDSGYTTFLGSSKAFRRCSKLLLSFDLLEHKVHIYREYQSVCLLVRNGTPHSLSRKRVYPPPNPRGEGTHLFAG